jgi:hypothetical protein
MCPPEDPPQVAAKLHHRSISHNRTKTAADWCSEIIRCGNPYIVQRTSPGATVALGAILSVGALVGATAAVVLAHPDTTVRVVIVAVAFALAIVGGIMMLKDLTP